jgi:hypothetical protein
MDLRATAYECHWPCRVAVHLQGDRTNQTNSRCHIRLESIRKTGQMPGLVL